MLVLFIFLGVIPDIPYHFDKKVIEKDNSLLKRNLNKNIAINDASYVKTIRLLDAINSVLAACTSEPGHFSSDFLFGTSISAYQTEGAWNEDGKGENLWDRITHEKYPSITDNATGDVACDSYHRLDRDIQTMEELGAKVYRFSISWARVLPTGYANVTNNAGIEYYNELINRLLKVGIEPIITLFHWDLPMNLQDQGGWCSSESVKWFSDYADFVLSQFADRVKYWITMNEAIIYCDYMTTLYTPEGFIDPERAPYVCSKNQLLAHASAYRIYDKKYRSKRNGVMSMSNLYAWYQNATDNEDERVVTEILLQYKNGRFNHPIYSKEGGWPPLLIEYMDIYSKTKGYNTSLLPPFSEEEKEFIKGTADFIGMNHYSSYYVSSNGPVSTSDMPLANSPNSWRESLKDIIVQWLANDKPHAYALNNYAPGIRHLINWLAASYGDWDILITENGYAGKSRTVEDVERINYIQAFLEQILLSINEDGVNVIGYTYWSLMDNFEWFWGYNSKFGLYDVDFEDPKKRSTMRSSAAYYACIIQKRTIDGCSSLLTPVFKDEQN